MTKRYYQVTGFQLFMCSFWVGIISASLISINMHVRENLLTPIVIQTPDGKCTAVENFKNGEAFTCADVGVILRNYRIKKTE